MFNDDILKWKRLVESINMMEAPEDDAHADEHPDHEISMAKSQLLSAVKSATRIAKHLSHISEQDGIEAWVASKLTMAEDYLQVVADYMDGEHIQDTYDDLSESKEEDDDEMIQGFDPKTKAALIHLKTKFPRADNILAALVADMEDSQTISQNNDVEHDKRLDGIEKRMDKIEKEVTLGEDQDFHEEYGYLAFSEDEMDIFEAEYQGRKVKLNKPMRGDVKKFKVYVKNEKGNVVKVNFGDPDMKIKKSNPKRRKSFRARHNCDNPGPKTKARYWSCRKW